MTEQGSKYFDVATFSISGEARDEFEEMRDATIDSETIHVITESGTTYRVIPQDRENDTVSVWGISDHEHPRTGYSRFKGLGNAELETIPLRTLAELAIRRVKDIATSPFDPKRHSEKDEIDS